MNNDDQNTCRLYLITPPRLEPTAFSDTLAQALDAGDVAAVQLRLKDVDDDAICRAAEVLAPIAQSRDVAFIMNDRPDLAQRTGCDGVHVGQQDASYKDARALLGPSAIVGVTCHDSRHLAMEAGDQGADYVAFGAFSRRIRRRPSTSPIQRSSPGGAKQRPFRASPSVGSRLRIARRWCTPGLIFYR